MKLNKQVCNIPIRETGFCWHKSVRSLSTITLGLLGSLGLIIPANAQVSVTGGTAVFNNSRIFVPDSGNVNPLTEVYDGSTPDRILIRTSQGNIPLNAIFRTSVLPSLNVPPGGTPQVGNTGTVLGTLTFRGFTASGEPGFFNNIPTELNFQITSGNFSGSQRFTKYQTRPFSLTDIGAVSTQTTSATTARTTGVVAVQFQPGRNRPQAQPFGNSIVPAFFYNTAIPGNSFSANFTAHLRSGNIQIPNPPGFNGNATTNQTPNQTRESVNNGTPSVVFVPIFNYGWLPPTILGTTQGVPIMPTTILVGIFRFVSIPSGFWYDPPLAEAFEFEMTPSPQPVGLTSRVFPGMTGTEISSDSVFTAISGFPQGVDADDRFTVSVDGVELGEFGPGDVLNFKDYQEQLGERLVNEEGVLNFKVSAIAPGVDATNELGFPIKLEFSTPTASFEMKAQGEGLEDSSASAFRLPEQVETSLQEKFNRDRAIPLTQNWELSEAQ
ncbi:hypothetical protein [Lusitaniella coriacea]|uniref:hypothetical protein n=1 Tax=Lusitaniella coriacea TaxID=1983105 RepID=UPI003CEDD09B